MTASKTNRHIGQHIRQARLRCKASQQDVGDIIGVTFQAIQKMENGTIRVSSDDIVKIARFLKQPVEWFYSGLGPEDGESNPAIESFFNDRNGIEIARALHTRPRLKSVVAALCSGLAKE